MRVLSIFTIFVLASCSQIVKKDRVLKEDPNWLYSPSDGCRSYELCATGEGHNSIESDGNAKKSLASIFATEISGYLELSKYSYSKESLSEIQEAVSEGVNEKVHGVLKGAAIKERFEKEGIFFSLISIDKRRTGRILTQEIRSLDKEISSLMKLKNRIYLKKLNILYSKREILNEKLIILDEKGISSRYNKEKINALKFDLSKPSKIFVSFGQNLPDFIIKKIKEILNDLGYQSVQKKEADYHIIFKFVKKKEYINVKGFKKFSFELSGESRRFNEVIGNLVIKHTEAGRSSRDVLFRAKELLIKEFENNIQKLQMD